MKRVTALLIVILAVPLTTRGQEPPAPAPAPAQNPSETVDVSKLGVSVARIRRELWRAEAKERSGGGPLMLEFTVEVFGTAPKISLLENFPLTGPVPYGGPTHREVVDFLTPQEYRSPTIPFSAMAVWAAQQLWNRSKRQRCEAELEEYKRLVMQGVSVAAPRCTQ